MKKSFLIKSLFIVVLFLGIQHIGLSQDLLKGKDLSLIKVDMLSNADIQKLKSQLTASGMSLDQAEQLAISKGMTQSEANKLKQKLLATSGTVTNETNNLDKKSIPRENSEPDELDKSKKTSNIPLINPLIFGSELYTATSLSFEPNLKMATPINYILGPEDQIQVTVYGVQEYNGSLSVSPEGTINVPNVGEIRVSGLTIEAATQKIKNSMSNSVYPYLKSGGSKISVSLSKIRTISVTIIGSNKPGNYKVSSLASVFNALYMAGGPSNFGSFREIELIRNNKIERKIDLYKFLLEGSQIDNIALKDNDVIRIPVYKTRIELKGEVKRPGIFEVLPGETFSKVLSYSSGFTEDAYKNSVKIVQRNDKEKEILDLSSVEFQNYNPKSGDIVEVSKILERFKNRVVIQGAVFRPDQYELSKNLHIADLIRKADGLTADAFSDRGQIIRLKENLSKTVLSFDVKKAMEGNSEHNLILQREDSVIITSIRELKDRNLVTIQGEIRSDGKFEYFEGLTLKDLILKAGGFTNSAAKSIEIARLIIRDSIEPSDTKASQIINTEIASDDLGLEGAANLKLSPFDVVTVRKKAGYRIPQSVNILGQVQYPGPYSLSSTIERVSDLLKRSGGFTTDAFPEGAYLKRYKSFEDKETSKDALGKLSKAVKDTNTQKIDNEILRDFDKIPLQIQKILKDPGSLEDLILKENDEIFVPKFDGQIRVSGEVLLNSQIPFDKKKSFSDYISSSGGFTSNALRRKTYVVYANGMAASTKSFFFFKTYPKLEPGCELIVPKKREKKVTNTAEIIGIASAVASLAGVTLAIMKL